MKIFTNALFYSAISLLLTFLVVPQAFGLLSICIIAFYAHDKIDKFLERNRENIIVKKMDKKQSNIQTIKELVLLFFGIALPYLILFWIFNGAYLTTMFDSVLIKDSYLKLSAMQIAEVRYIALNSFVGFVISIIFSYLFRNYAIALFLSLGAVSLGVSTGAMLSFGMPFIVSLKSFILVVLPYQLFLISLILTSLGIYFLRKGMDKYYTPYFNNKEKVPEENKIILKSIVKTTGIILTISTLGISFSILWQGVIMKLLSN